MLTPPSINRTEGGDDEETIAEIQDLKERDAWSADFGDRSQELVMIGVHLDKERMRQELEKALLTDEEVEAGKKNLNTWMEMEDPFFGGQCAELYWELPEESDEEGDEEEGDEEEEEEGDEEEENAETEDEKMDDREDAESTRSGENTK